MHALQVIRVLHNKTLAKAAHDIKRLKIMSDISQFDAQILKLTTYVFLWIHWNACLQYGSCVAQPDSRYVFVAASRRVWQTQCKVCSTTLLPGCQLI